MPKKAEVTGLKFTVQQVSRRLNGAQPRLDISANPLVERGAPIIPGSGIRFYVDDPDQIAALRDLEVGSTLVADIRKVDE